MCGIFGFTGTDEKLLKRGTDVINYRGPDQFGTWTNEVMSFGHRRLSIIDLSEKGRQPMANKNETLHIVFNGEIFNFKDIRSKLKKRGHRFNSDTDTEVILNAYAEYGEDCVQLFNGMFAFCIYDMLNKKLFLARDRLGVKPLYYALNKDRFYFASEIKSILEDDSFSREINKEMLSRYLAFRCVYGIQTIFKNIFRVLPGESIKYDFETKELERQIYWEAKFTPQSHISFQDANKHFLKLFNDSVEKRLISDVPLGVFLSGGLDSSSIVAMMRQKDKNADIKTFSVGFGYGEETDELSYARKMSEYFNTTHREFIVKSQIAENLPKIIWHCDEPLADPALLPVYLLSQQAKKYATVILTGDGGDELLAGYEQIKFLQIRNKMGLLRNLAAPALSSIPTNLLNHIFKYAESLGSKGKERAKKMLSATFDEDAYIYIVSIFDESEQKNLLNSEEIKLLINFNKRLPFVQRILEYEEKTILPENMLMKTDRMTMAWSIEGRTPFLDYRLVDFVNRLPPSYKINIFNNKLLLRKSMQKYVPLSILKRKKQRFYVPIDKWMKEDLAPFVDEHLSQQKILEQGIFNYSYIKRIKDKFDDSPLYYSRQLWSLLTFQIWHDKFIG